MTGFELLHKKISESGMPISVIAARSNIRRETLYNRFNGIGEFTASEIVALTKVLSLKKSERDAIFFANQVEFNSTVKED